MPETIREKLNGKPGNAIRAMIAGLKSVPNNNKRRIRMQTFGNVANGTCFGCAATWAIDNIYGGVFDEYNIENTETRANATGVHYIDLAMFETAMDAVRCGITPPLLRYFGASEWDAEEKYRPQAPQVTPLTNANAKNPKALAKFAQLADWFDNNFKPSDDKKCIATCSKQTT